MVSAIALSWITEFAPLRVGAVLVALVDLAVGGGFLVRFNWQGSSVRAVESGRASPTIHLLFAMAAALENLAGRPLPLAELVSCDDDQPIQINKGVTLRGGALKGLLRGQSAGLIAAEVQETAGSGLDALRLVREQGDAGGVAAGKALFGVEQLIRTSGEAESRAAKGLGISVGQLAYWSHRLWGRLLSEERDVRAGDANPQKRGRTMRELKSELQLAIEEAASDGDD
ncbi:hypothetical protein [Rhodococcus sp. USK13]|uniref:hypothetical protein n=1 Tax=Rhodococcus sp. USK13 TaxID=2806442 RepID=UPI001BCABF63|nr:hypothetical protein [Rhodococcus sp. USK13]